MAQAWAKKLKLSPEKTKIVRARSKGVEFLGFHFNGRWRNPRDKAKKKFKEEIKRRTRRQQPVNLETVIRFLNPVIRGWGNYFKEGTVKTLFGELDGYIRGRLRSFKAKRRNWNTIQLVPLKFPSLNALNILVKLPTAELWGISWQEKTIMLHSSYLVPVAAELRGITIK